MTDSRISEKVNPAKAHRLPGSIYLRRGRWWWAVQLPDEKARSAHKLVPDSQDVATANLDVAIEVAKMMLERARLRVTPTRHSFDGTVAGLAALYLNFARRYYVDPDTHQETVEVKKIALLIKQLNQKHAQTRAESFDTTDLIDFRDWMISEGYARRTINDFLGTIRRMFKWAVPEKLVPSTTAWALTTVKNLARGRAMGANEPPPVEPVAMNTIQKTLPYMSPVPRDMVTLQRLTGMRSTEICIMRGVDIDTTGEIWVYRPTRHKNKWRGHKRAVPLGPQAMAIVRRYLPRPSNGQPINSYLFSPAESERLRHEEMRSERKSVGKDGKPWPSHLRRLEAKRKGIELSDHYDRASYHRAVDYAIHKGNKAIMAQVKADLGPAAKPKGVQKEYERRAIPHWHPHQLRHTAAQVIRYECGLDAARAILGHKTLGMTDTYGPIDERIAIDAARKIG